MRTTEELQELDARHVWHPYASLPPSVLCFPVASASGTTIQLTDGRELVDGMSSWWACVHGYQHPVLNQAARDQIDTMAHVMFGGLTHAPAVELAQKLAQQTGLEHVFFCDSGSVAIEVAMKMALQYWHNVQYTGTTTATTTKSKNRFLTIRGGYHGDTFEAMSVCDPVNGMHHLFTGVLQQQIFAPRPESMFHADSDENKSNDDVVDRDVAHVEGLLQKHEGEIAAIILEPIVQGAGGMRFYSPQYLKRVRELCDNYDVLLIADEIATGFGRTGKLFACEHANISPDILCLGKALSGGFMSFAATLTTPRVAQAFADGPAGVFMHGPTFMGNPLACAVSLASINLLESYDWQAKVQSIEGQLREELEPCRESPIVHDVRVLGAIGVVEMKEPFDMKKIQPAVVDEGVWLRPFGKLLYTMPPFVIDRSSLKKLTTAMVKLTRRKL